jgi:hypothetical protein
VRDFLLPLPGLPPAEDLRIRHTALKWARMETTKAVEPEKEPLFDSEVSLAAD